MGPSPSEESRVIEGLTSGAVPETVHVGETAGNEFNAIDAEIAVWSQTGLFEELVRLEREEEEALRSMLTAAEEGSVRR
jgi:hypothetical protein